MKSKKTKTYWVKVFAAGAIEIAKQVCREEFLKKGLCITIEPTLFIYTGGEEIGFVIGLINYPRFPASPSSIRSRARQLAIKILDRTCQHSTLIMTPEKTEWITKRKE